MRELFILPTQASARLAGFAGTDMRHRHELMRESRCLAVKEMNYLHLRGLRFDRIIVDSGAHRHAPGTEWTDLRLWIATYCCTPETIWIEP